MSKEDVFVVGDYYYLKGFLYRIKGIALDESGEVMVTYSVLQLDPDRWVWNEGALPVDEFGIAEMRHLPDVKEVQPIGRVFFRGEHRLYSQAATEWRKGALAPPGRSAMTGTSSVSFAMMKPAVLLEDGVFVAQGASFQEAMLWVACGVRPLDTKTWV